MNTENSSEMESPNWYILLTKPYREIFVSKRLDELGIDCFLPLVAVRLCWEKKTKHTKNVVIPRVIFIRTLPDRLRELSEQLNLCVMSSPQKVCCSAWEVDNLKFFFSELVSWVQWSFEFCLDDPNGEIVTLADGKMKGLKGYISVGQPGVICVPCCGLG
ncbi:MAG: hypothetical protein LUF04_15765, partial [Bacteroides sp.]|nr:hypothetical protein [Bacteroides sp.]